MSYTQQGYGDRATWNAHAKRNDPQMAEELDACETWARAQSIAHDPARLDELQADGPLDYSKIQIKVDSEYVDLFAAADYLRLRIMAGRHAEADVIARDMTDALATEIEALIRAGRL